MFLRKQVRWVWYSHVLKNFPAFVVIHTVKGFGIVNKAEIDVFLEPHLLELHSIHLNSGGERITSWEEMGKALPPTERITDFPLHFASNLLIIACLLGDDCG